MNIEIKEAVRKYYVSFEQDRTKKFSDGPNRGRPQTVTECTIILLTESSRVTLVGRGVTTLGKEDKANNLIGCTMALTRALDDAKLGKHANGLFWQEFRLRHRRLDAVTCREVYELPKTLLDSAAAFEVEVEAEARRVRAMKKMVALGNSPGRRLVPIRAERQRRKSQTTDIKVININTYADVLERMLADSSRIKDILEADANTKRQQCCGRLGDFLQGPRGGEIKCILCNQKYSVCPETRTAKKIQELTEKYCEGCGRLGCVCGD